MRLNRFNFYPHAGRRGRPSVHRARQNPFSYLTAPPTSTFTLGPGTDINLGLVLCSRGFHTDSQGPTLWTKALAPSQPLQQRLSAQHKRYTTSDGCPREEEDLFRSRLATVWKGLLTFPKTQTWEQTLSGTPSEAWLSLIEKHTVEGFRSILSSQQPPTVSQLESLEWSDTAAAGVYAWVLKPKRKRIYRDDECYIYLGSAGKYGDGLAGKRHDLLGTWPSARQQPPRPEIRKLGLSSSKLVTLFEMPFSDDSDEEIRKIRSLLALARAVFVIWLGAVQDVSKLAIDEFTPWRSQDITYHGLASHKPLVFNIKGPK